MSLPTTPARLTACNTDTTGWPWWRRALRRAATWLWDTAAPRPPAQALAPGLPQPPQGLQACLRHLNRSEQQLRQAEALAAIGSFEWYPQTGELHWSDEHYRLWGLAPGSVLPSYSLFRDGVHPDDLPQLDRVLAAALAGPGSYDCEHRVVQPDGRVRQIHARGQVAFNAQGQAWRMVGTVQDVSAEREAEARLHRYEFLVNAITDPVSLMDRHGVYRLVNPAWSQATGLAPEAVLDQPRGPLHGRLATAERDATLARCLATGQPQSLRALASPDGHAPRWWETTMFPYSDPLGHWHGVAMVSRDVHERQLSRQALADSVDNLRLTLNATGDGIFASGSAKPDEPLLFVNERLLQIFHIPPERLDGLSAADVLAAAARWFVQPQAELARIQEIIDHNLLQEDRLALNDGRVLMRRCIPTRDHGRAVRVWSFRDVTVEAHALQALQAAESRQRALLAAFPGHMASIDAQHRFVDLNPALAALWGQAVPALLQQRADLRADGTVDTALCDVLDRALAGATVQAEHSVLPPGRPDGPAVPLLLTLAPSDPEQPGRGVYLFGVDISPLKHTEAALREAKRAAEAANAAKTRFLSDASHELRTPLNALLGFAQLMALDPGLPARNRDQVQAMRRGGQHLRALVNDLLDLARVESGQLQLQTTAVDLAAVASECLHLVQADAQRCQVALHLAPPAPNARAGGADPGGADPGHADPGGADPGHADPGHAGAQHAAAASPPGCWVSADHTRLRQVLLNLLSNAVKYNRPGGWVRLDWVLAEGCWQVAVHDSGPGLDAAQQQRLFTPFERLDAERRGIDGSGLGLVLSRRLVQAMGGPMGGQMGVVSAPGAGSSFWFTLSPAPAPAPALLPDRAAPMSAPPAQSEPTAALPLPEQTAPDTNPVQAAAAAPDLARTVLYIEDNPVNATLMAAMLDSLPGVRTLVAGEPEQGLALARQQGPDLVLVDIQMPGMNGYQVLHHLRADPATRQIPVFAVSANAMADDLARGQAAGFDAYLTKPLDLGLLLRTVCATLGLPEPADLPND